MNTKCYLAILLSLVLFSCENDERRIETLFDNYRSALATKDYDFICSSLDSKTVELFQVMASLAQSADSMKLSRAAIFIRHQVLLLRQRLDKDALLNLSGRDVCQIGTLIMTTQEELLTSQLGVSRYKDEQAVYYLIIDGKQSESPIYFVKEGSQWKVNAAKAFSAVSNMSLLTSLNTRGDRGKQNEMLKIQVENVTGQPLKAHIWDPPASW